MASPDKPPAPSSSEQPSKYRIIDGKIHVRCGLCGDWHHYSTTYSLTIHSGFGIGWVDTRRKSTYNPRATSVSRIGNAPVQRVMFPKHEKFNEVCPRCFAEYDANGERRTPENATASKKFDATPRLVKTKKGVRKP